MRTLDYQSVLERLYRHFVMDQNPPGMVDGIVRYHQGGFDDPVKVDCPCAIGLFDTEHRLDNANFDDKYVRDIYARYPGILADIFGLQSVTQEDVRFLSKVQEKHDYHALDAHKKPWRPIETFRNEMADALEGIAREHGLKPLAF